MATPSGYPFDKIVVGPLGLSPFRLFTPKIGFALEITYLGHSAFRLRGKDVTIVTDPFPPELGLSMGKVTADVVTVSHMSPNHSFLSGVGGLPRVIRGPGEYEVADILIAGVATETKPGLGPVNTAYVLRLDEVVLCHLGDARKSLTDEQIEAIGNIDILMLPVGGGNVLDPDVAAQVVTQLEPSYVLPMHYSFEGSTVAGLAPVDHFCREMGTKEVSPEPKLTVSRSGLPAVARVVVLESRSV